MDWLGVVRLADLMDRISNILGFAICLWMVGNLANRITLIRMRLGEAAALLLILGGAQEWIMSLIACTIFLDAVDGWVARTYHTEGKFGAALDRYSDYYVAGVMWLALAVRGLVEPLVPAITISRDLWLVLRPVSRSKIGWLSSAPSMRAGYAILKLASWELAIARPGSPAASVLVWITVGTCLLRALPTLVPSRRSNSP